MQIPTENFAGQNLTDAEKAQKNAEYIAKAKDTIGKVVKLQFEEQKTVITDADKTERKTIAQNALTDIKTGEYDFATIAKKYTDNYENIDYQTGAKALKDLPLETTFTGIENVKAPYVSDILEKTRL